MKSMSIKALVLGAIMTVSGWNGVLHAQTSEQLPLLVAAGSLKTAMDETLAAYQAQGGSAFNAKYGPSGKLRKEIEAGAKVDVFASADIEHTNALTQQKLLGESSVFTHNDLCVIARPALGW